MEPVIELGTKMQLHVSFMFLKYVKSMPTLTDRL